MSVPVGVRATSESDDIRDDVPSRNVVMVSKVGLTFSHDMCYEEWVGAGEKISRIVNSTAWCLGDWLVCGEDRYANRYRCAVVDVCLDYQTLRNYAWVVRRFPLHRRRAGLSFQHHAEVAALPVEEQDDWLDKAERHSWSRNQLRQQLRANATRGSGSGHRVATLPRVRVPAERVARWRVAASRSGDGFEGWVVAALDRAAEQELIAAQTEGTEARGPSAADA